MSGCASVRGFLAVLLSMSSPERVDPPGLAEDAFQQIKAVSPPVPGRRLEPKDYQIAEWVLGPQRQRDRKPLNAKSLFEFPPLFYVEDVDSHRWLVGRSPKAASKSIECDSQFPNLRALLDAHAFAPVPEPPEGFSLREVVRLPNFPTRLASDCKGTILFILCLNGDVWRLDLASADLKQILWGDLYVDADRGERLLVGMALDPQNRLYLVCNQRNERVKPVTNEVTIFRTTTVRDGLPADPKPWLQISYPWGIGPFNHGVGHIAFGPDGFLYVNSGSRTDGNEPGNDPRYSKEGETPLTACIWRLDPGAIKPEVEIYARGLRNAYGFCWNDKDEMFATDNGPDADAPEELNLIEKGKHYGFPFQFSNWTDKPYKHTPDPPANLRFTLPIANLGPDGGGRPDQPLFSFDPHSSPAGIVFLRDDFPPRYRGTFLLVRFGNLLERPRVGFDLQQVILDKNKAGGVYQARVKTLLFPLARPLDLHLCGKGKVFICEYSRQIDNKGFNGMLPGRVLELAVKRSR